MNIAKKWWCRIYQGVFRLALPILPYHEPQQLENNESVAEVLTANNVTKVLLVTDQGLAKLHLFDPLVETLNQHDITVVVYDKTVPNPTTDNVEESYIMYKDNDCQAIIAFGGGSPMDCAKATGIRVVKPKKALGKFAGVIKLWKRLPLLIAVPTTAGTGSETTLAAVITDSNTRHKYAISSFPLIPRYALLDPTLTIGLPPHITSTTGMDALTHAVEAFIGRSTTKETRTRALDAVKLIFANLEEAYNNGSNLEARRNMLLASYYAGIAFTKSYVGYVHAIAHSLGGKYNTPHGLANAIILPYMLKKYGRKIYKKLWKLGVYAELFSADTPMEVGAKLLIEKIESMNANMHIGQHLDIKKEDIPLLAQQAEKEGNPLYPVPVLMTAKELEAIYYEVAND